MTPKNSTLPEADRHVQSIGFILVPGFALMSYASATEPFRAANLIAGRALYRVSAHTLDGAPGLASSGVLVPAKPLPKQGAGLDFVFAIAGGEPRLWDQPPIFACLRMLSREGVRIGGISGGPYLLAAAGLLNERRFTIHWEHAPLLLEAFPDLTPEQARYVLDGNRMTCGGGIAPLDMMHALITERMGADFARRVSDWYLHTHVGSSAAPQRASLAERHGVHHPALLSVIEKMEASLEAPLSRDAMARFAGLTPRHLDRLFSSHLKTTYLAKYRSLRLDHARRLLQQSTLPILEIALATGFSSPGHFARVYRAEFQKSPRDER
ncbi:MAG: hypothetical protein RIR97_1024 [Pseudomonadota bacterium]